ncbi:MAG: hypothetical protein PHR56_00655 [Dehalococcoidales bacterium]|nr:hypothetical protein [Dehalococcoidales bacterium]
MFFNARRSKDKGVPPEKPGEDSAELKVQQIESLEELVARRTQGLKEAQQQLSQLTTEAAPKEGKEDPKVDALFTQPAPPVEAAKLEETVLKTVDLNSLLKTETPPVEVKAAPAVEKVVAEKKPEEIMSDSLADLFNQEDEKENPLAGLIRSLPVVSAGELLNEAKEVSTIIREWRR